MNNSAIASTDRLTFLGLTFDKALTWLPYLKELTIKCKKSLNLLRILSNTKWGADRFIMLTLYRSYTRSLLDYGCIVYTSASPSTLKLLDPIHYTRLRIATGAFRSSQTESLCAYASEPPLEYRWRIICSQFISKCKSVESKCLTLQ